MKRTRTNKKHKRYNYVSVATKVSHKDKDTLNLIAQHLGLSLYELQRTLLHSLIRHYDPLFNVANVMDGIITGMAQGDKEQPQRNNDGR